MSMNDPIADALTKIRNANAAHHETVTIPLSKIKLSIVEILKENGFVKDFELIKDDVQGHIKISLKYGPKKSKVILGLKRVSRGGRRYYVDKDHIPRIQGGLGIAILSTSHGVMSDKKARQEQVGGEVICYAW